MRCIVKIGFFFLFGSLILWDIEILDCFVEIRLRVIAFRGWRGFSKGKNKGFFIISFVCY